MSAHIDNDDEDECVYRNADYQIMYCSRRASDGTVRNYTTLQRLSADEHCTDGSWSVGSYSVPGDWRGAYRSCASYEQCYCQYLVLRNINAHAPPPSACTERHLEPDRDLDSDEEALDHRPY